MPLEHRTRKHVTPGRSYPLGATPAGDGVNFALYSRARHRRVPAAVRRSRTATPPTSSGSRTATSSSGTRSSRASAPGSSTATTCAASIGPNWDCASTTPSCSSIRTRRPSPGSSATPTTCCSPTTRVPAAATCARHARHHRGRAEGDRRSTTAFDWQGDVSPDLALEQLVIYEVHVKGFTAHPSSARAVARHLPRLHREDPAPDAARRQRGRAPAGPRVLRRRLPASARGLTNYWGYNTIGFFAPECVVRHAAATPGCQVAEFKTLVRDAAPRRHRGASSTSSTTTPARATRLGPTLVFRGIDNPTLLQPDRSAGRAAALLHELHRLRQQPRTSTAHPSSAS